MKQKIDICYNCDELSRCYYMIDSLCDDIRELRQELVNAKAEIAILSSWRQESEFMNKEELMMNMDRCINGISQVDCEDCPYNKEHFCVMKLMQDALNYIKGEAVLPMTEKITKEQAIDILEKFEFFQGQRAGRALWNAKPYDVQEKDLEDFSRDCRLLIDYIQQTAVPFAERENKINDHSARTAERI